MAQDYDSPRNKDEDEESLQALSKGSQNNSNDMDDDCLLYTSDAADEL